MTLPAPTYDLVLLLDASAEDDARAKLLADARAMIEGKGEVVRYDKWGDRQLAYPIDDKTNAEYHLLQFHASSPELLGELDRTLRIADGIVRFRIVKLKPGTPDAPEMLPPAALIKQPEPIEPIEPVAAVDPEPSPVAEPA